jgi:transposase
MDVIYTHCAGMDVHKKTVVVCCLTPDERGKLRKHTRTFSTMTADLLQLGDWLIQHEITHVAMESTGEYWKPLYNLLEASFTVLVVNAQHIKTVPGRKTDVKDAEWIADLLRHGLLQGSFIPPEPQRDLRDLTRQRTLLVQERVRVINRLQKALEWANLKLASVVTDIMGASARAMLTALIDGQSDVQELADLAKGRLREKRADLERALTGQVRDHHRFLLTQHLAHIDFLDAQIATFDQQIADQIAADTPDHPDEPAQPAADRTDTVHPPLDTPTDAAPTTNLTWADAVEIWDSLPGIGRRVAEELVAEIGTDLHRFASARHLARWARLAPGNYESAGKQATGRTGKGSRWLKSVLVQAARAAVRVKGSAITAWYRRVAARRGGKKAIVAVAHKLLTLGYTLLQKREHYQERGPTAVDTDASLQQVQRMRRKMEQMGYTVHLEPRAAPAA